LSLAEFCLSLIFAPCLWLKEQLCTVLFCITKLLSFFFLTRTHLHTHRTGRRATESHTCSHQRHPGHWRRVFRGKEIGRRGICRPGRDQISLQVRRR
jgi:hypothetical protein